MKTMLVRWQYTHFPEKDNLFSLVAIVPKDNEEALEEALNDDGILYAFEEGEDIIGRHGDITILEIID